jgi:hypothetical protein
MVGLADSTGNTQFVPLEWTDRHPPNPCEALPDPKPMLNVRCLLRLAQLIGARTTTSTKGTKGD